MHAYIVLAHVLGATIWTGGHLVLALAILPSALKQRNAALISQFESRFERIGMPALLLQVVTGLWLAYRLLPNPARWFSFEDALSRLIMLKFVLLALTLALAISARVRIIPHLTDRNLTALALHIVPVTIISVLLVVVGVAIRTGGIF